MDAPVPIGAPLQPYAQPVFLREVLDDVVAELPLRRHLVATGAAAPPPRATITRSPRLVLALGGRNRMELPAGERVRTATLLRGDVAVMGERAWNRPLHQWPMTFLTIDCKRDLIRYYWRRHAVSGLESGSVCQHLRLGPPPPGIQHLWRAVEALIARDGVAAEVAELVTTLLREFARELARDPEATSAAVATWRLLCDWIDEHLDRDVTRDGLARRFAIHPNHVSRVFRHQAGERFGDYLTRRRMERAAALLADFDIPVRDVARSCGYRDQAYFANVFRRHHGCSPSAWRRRRPHDAPD